MLSRMLESLIQAISRFIHILRSVVISPELVAILTLILLHAHYLNFFVWIESTFDQVSKLAFFAPLGAVICFTVRQISLALITTSDCEEFYKWPLYPKFRLTMMVGLVYVVLGAVLALLGLLSSTLPVGVAGLLFAIGYVLAGVSCFTVFNANLTAKSHLKGGE